MANNYEQIMALVNAGNKMGLSNTITRDNGIPLDLSSVYGSYNEAVIYAATKAIAYHGQPIAVITETDATMYVITPTSQGKVTIGETEYDVYLKQVGAKTLGDEKSIVLSENGILSLAGFSAAAGATLPQKQADGTIKWVAIDAIVEGDGNTKTVVASGDSQITVSSAHDEESDTYTYTLGLNVDFSNYLTKTQVEEAIATALQAAKDYADTNDANTVYDDTAIAGRVTAIETAIGTTEAGIVKDIADNKASIEAEVTRATAAEAKALSDAKSYVDSEINGLTVAIEQKNGTDHIVIKDKDGAEIASANASKFVQDSFLDDVAYNAETGNITFTWSMGDGTTKSDEVAVADFVQTYTAGNGITLTGNEFAIDATVVATVSDLNDVRAIANAAQTAQEVSDTIDAKIAAKNLDQYAVKTEVETALGNYAKTADINTTLADYAKTADIVDTYATKTELTTGLAAKVDAGTIAHTSEGVEEGVTRDGTTIKIVVDAYTKAETLDKIQEKITEINGGESAGEVLGQLNSYKETNDAAIAALQAKNGTQDTAIAAAQTAAEGAQATADAAATAVSDLGKDVTANKNDIDAIVVRLGAVETTSSTNTENVAKLDGRLTAIEPTVSGHTIKIGTIEGNITALTNEDTRLAGLVTELTTGKANAADVYTKEETETAISDAIAAIPATDLSDYAKTADVNTTLESYAKSADVYTKAEADAAFMSESEVDSRINALILASDPEGGKTITNIQNLVTYVDENAGEIAGLVTATNANTAKLAGIDTTVVDYINNNVVQPKASNEVTIATDGTLGVGQVDVSKLVQSEDSILVLNGGSAV